MTRAAFRHLALLICVACAGHGASPPDWLVLPAAGDARPAGTSTWVLANMLRVSQDDPDSVVYHYRFAVMPLTEAGVKRAGFAIPYVAGSSSVSLAKAWAMSPDGKKCREFGGTDFIVSAPVVNDLTWDQSKFVSFGAQKFLQPGWIIAWEVEIRADTSAFDIGWNPRGAWPVRTLSLELVPPKNGSVKWKAFSDDLPAPVAIGGGGMRWSEQNLPGVGERVPSSMERDTMRLRAYLLAGPGEDKSWAQVVTLARSQIEPKAVLTPVLGDLARKLSGTGDLWSRIGPVCRFVQKDVSYLQVTIDSDSMAGYRPHAAAEVCENRFGDCKDKAVLLCTLLRSLGVESFVTLVNSGSRTVNRADWPSAAFNHAIVAIACVQAAPAGAPVIHAAGRDFLLFDPTHEFVPLGLLPEADAGGLGLVLAPGCTDAVAIPQAPADVPNLVRQIKMVIANDGSAAVNISEDRTGLPASVAVTNDETEPLTVRTSALEKRIQQKLPLVSDITWKSAPDDSGLKWSLQMKFNAQYVGRRLSGEMYVPTDVFSVVPGAEPWGDKDAGHVTVPPANALRELSITLPTEWKVSALPEDWSFKSAAGTASVHYASEGGMVRGEISLIATGGVLDRGQYAVYRELLHATLVAERRPVVLRRISPAAPAPQPSAPPATARAASS